MRWIDFDTYANYILFKQLLMHYGIITVVVIKIDVELLAVGVIHIVSLFSDNVRFVINGVPVEFDIGVSDEIQYLFIVNKYLHCAEIPIMLQ